MIIGVIESVGPQFMTATWTEAIVYGLFLVFLFVKPSGLVRRQVRLVAQDYSGQWRGPQ